MKKAVVTLILMLTTMLPFPAKAADGKKLLEQCMLSDPFGTGYCLGLITGIRDATSIHQGVPGSFKVFCVPKGPLFKLVPVVVKFIQENPKYLHERDSTAVILALTKSFPCKSK